jgi:hypothetical protein
MAATMASAPWWKHMPGSTTCLPKRISNGGGTRMVSVNPSSLSDARHVRQSGQAAKVNITAEQRNISPDMSRGVQPPRL